MQNACEIVRNSESVKAFLLASSWHVFGERGFRGVVDEGFGFRPDSIEPRARLYALSKIAQEAVVTMFDEMSSKVFGIVRLGTVLGENMPAGTAASLFVENSIRQRPLTPFKHTMYRPMLYVDIHDACRAFKAFSGLILSGKVAKTPEMTHVVNLFWAKPITIMELALLVSYTVRKLSHGKLHPVVKVEDQGFAPMYRPADKLAFKVDNAKAKTFLGLSQLTNPRTTINRIIAHRLKGYQEPGVTRPVG
jgi:UDP-glucose 4-epimerase